MRLHPILVVLLVGLAASGWIALALAPPAAERSTPPTVDAEPTAAPTAAPAVACPPPPTCPESRPVATSASCAHFVSQIRGLRGELRAARQQLGELEAAADAAEPLRAFPADLPSIYTEDELTRRILRAVSETELSGDIDTIDCTEYPCIAVGTLPDRADLDRLMGHPDMQGFAAGGRSSGFGSGPDGAPHFYVSFYPLAHGADVSDAISARFQRMVDERYAAPPVE